MLDSNLVGGLGRQRASEEDEGGRGEVEGGDQHQHGPPLIGQCHLGAGGREERTRQPHPIQGFKTDQAVAGMDTNFK